MVDRAAQLNPNSANIEFVHIRNIVIIVLSIVFAFFYLNGYFYFVRFEDERLNAFTTLVCTLIPWAVLGLIFTEGSALNIALSVCFGIVVLAITVFSGLTLISQAFQVLAAGKPDNTQIIQAISAGNLSTTASLVEKDPGKAGYVLIVKQERHFMPGLKFSKPVYSEKNGHRKVQLKALDNGKILLDFPAEPGKDAKQKTL
jgi:multisubunit Na+/H+ antiporter MnhG subunit